MVEKLKTFIKDNNLSFKEGQRNTNATILCGYALFIGASIQDCKESIPTEMSTGQLNAEIERVYNYADDNNYGKWWEKPEAAKMYKF